MADVFESLSLIEYGPKAKTEGVCVLCNWSRFEYDLDRLRSVYEYHFSEVHNAIDPLIKFDMAFGGPSTSSWRRTDSAKNNVSC